MNKKRIARENLNAWFLQNAFQRGYQKGYRAGVKGTTKKYYKNLTECAELETRMKKAYGDPKIWREQTGLEDWHKDPTSPPPKNETTGLVKNSTGGGTGYGIRQTGIKK
jgi:hypothetical protein